MIVLAQIGRILYISNRRNEILQLKVSVRILLNEG